MHFEFQKDLYQLESPEKSHKQMTDVRRQTGTMVHLLCSQWADGP